MKNILVSALFVISNFALAQQAGKAGQLLENKAKTEETRSNNQKAGNIVINKNKNYRTNTGRTNSSQFRWNYNYGYAEVFLRIPENGYFTVEIGDQIMGNASGKFRFFDLPSGNIPISIYSGDFLVYNSVINVKNNTRIVLDFFTDYGLYLLDNYPVQAQNYGYKQWDDVWNNPYNQNGNSYYYNDYQVMNDEQFSGFMAQLSRQSFDKDRLSFINAQMPHTWFTANQIYEILKQFSFEDKKLDLAKKMFHKCVDKPNFYRVYDAFDFDSYKQKLMNYVSEIR
ncbi:MAG: DUF4476 domain-containing protein [Cruoricaptor ignavus]|nr:DUF4476 domain-containing protein [Cruoricaptor ignavus]